MKFSSLPSFEKYLHESSLSPAYLVASSDIEERARILSQISAHLQKKHPAIELVSLSQKENCFSELCSAVSTLPFFSSHILVRLDDVGVFSKKEKEHLQTLIEKPSSFAFLLMGVSSLKDFSSICSHAKEELVCLDLTQEKPWDKARRIKTWVERRCFEAGKKISSHLVDEIVASCGADIALLESELNKLFTYLGQGQSITEHDVKSICVNYTQPTGWQMAEQLVFEGKAPIKDPSFSLSDLLPLLGQLRYHLTTARQVAHLCDEGCAKEGITSHMPQLRSSALDKYMLLSKSLSTSYFDEGLQHLFKVELLSKNSSLPAPLLWDYLAAHLFQLRRIYDKKR